MYSSGSKKELIILILDILKEYSDENHKLTQQEILKILKTSYGVECDRRSVKNNILSLTELGYDISMENGYYLVSREFEDAELRLLIDGVFSSKNVTNRQAQGLIKKLQAQGNKYFNPKVSHVSSLADMHRGDNKQLFYVIDIINDAITFKKKISFTYNAYGIDFKLHPKRELKYIVNPYQMVCANGFYYLIGNYDAYNDISHYRLDKITDVETLSERVKPVKQLEGMKNGLNLPKHMAEHIYMFSGESVRVKLDVPQSLMNELVDWLGKDFTILSRTDERMIISDWCNYRAMFYWALQYGAYVEVLEPSELREEIRDAISHMMERYSR